EIYHGQKISSQDLAASADANPSLIRSLIAKMVKAGILKPKSDAPAPQLSRPAAEITLLDVYYAVEENHHLLHVDEQTNQQCPVSKNIQP
ncbi:Rrf2 family transcriptional regulator, partial [[Ruminococcus] torques]